MILAQVGKPFSTTASGAEEGMLGTITVEVYDPSDGSSVVAPTTSGITEPRPGSYHATLTVGRVGKFLVRWATPATAAEEEVDVEVGGIAPSVGPYPAPRVAAAPYAIPTRAPVGAPFEAWLENAPAALGLDLTVQAVAADGTVAYGPSSDLVEVAPGRYRATLTLPSAGSYRVRWLFGTSEVSATVSATDITPTVADVSTLLYDRVIREGGSTASVFDDTTTPTGDQVEAIIAMAVIDLLGRLRTAVPPELVPQGRFLATVYAAMLVESTFAPEQTDTSAAYDSLSAIFNARYPDFERDCRRPARVPVA
jgi:hypothetical protein